jgi:1-aminocyclopropane-1-carboxylate deaminase/D-cysteine desulfhydrase-like pyridoxal-dependent ACC family enzyme
MQNSPVTSVQVFGRSIWIKRDDLLRPLSGNKARKLQYFIDLDWTPYKAVISYGGAQSNAMLALARLARIKHCPFVYYTRPLPAWLRDSACGNLRMALDLGMELRETDNFQLIPKPAGSLFIPQGVAMPEAEPGMQQLADEINAFAKHRQLDDLSVFMPSGTGTTALYLQQHLNYTVYTTPCVGDEAYLREQFNSLSADRHPQILDLPQKYVFAKPYPEFFAIWQALRNATGIAFDLLYDPKAWLVIEQHPELSPLLYIHCGGTEGNASMLARYQSNQNTPSYIRSVPRLFYPPPSPRGRGGKMLRGD